MAETAHPLRPRLIDAAARLIADEGPDALTLRRVASEAGTSTMGVYTHFGGMPALRAAVRREGFARLAAHLVDVEPSDDPVADVIRLARAYRDNAVENADLYRTMFTADAAADSLGWEQTFGALVEGVGRCIKAGRFEASDPTELAIELWALEHGLVALELAGVLSARQALERLESAGLRMFVAYGDAPSAASASLRRAAR